MINPNQLVVPFLSGSGLTGAVGKPIYNQLIIYQLVTSWAFSMLLGKELRKI